MLTEPALIVEHVAARLRVHAEIAIEHVPYRLPGHLARGTRNVALNVLRKPHGWHGVQSEKELAFHKLFQTVERRVPPRRNPLEAVTRGLDRLTFQFPNALPANPGAAGNPRVRQHVQMFCNSLPRDRRTRREASDRHRSAGG